ncbi:hypothetical protein FDP41_010003 [Naegleria fowleri]|uniref:THH1/TOM1/TOM3 domain-containing protein n=1 Tax=Naegleria fowleri TaxID=5763 RepID=A0A6A5BCH1_NAEFO|nr:uncharacterized protein FDP41_010003 [Naegleria fowleri]KAF0971780.1 hypothetical protein FDP41_010003 [Naegleria fowleri]
MKIFNTFRNNCFITGTTTTLGLLLQNNVHASPFSHSAIREEPQEDLGYTYDRIVLGIMTSLVCLYILLQIGLTFYHKHRVPSFHFGFLVLCCIWMILRTVYYFSVIDNCGVFFLYYIPICVEFAVFSLLGVFFFKLLNYGGKWEKSLLQSVEEPLRVQTPTPSSPSQTTGILSGSGVQNPVHSYRRRSYRPSSSTFSDNYGAVSNVGVGSLNNDDQDDDTKTDTSFVSQNIDAYEEESKISYYHAQSNNFYHRFIKFLCTRKVLYMILWLVTNLGFFFMVLSFCIASCTTAFDSEQTNSVIGLTSACSFAVLMVMLLAIGLRMVYIFRRRNDIPVSLKVSRITGPGMVVVIIVNCFVFTSRAIFDCLILIPNFPKDYLKIQFLRSTDYGRMFIIFTNFFWEIMPILSILIFFSKWSFSRNAVNINLRRHQHEESQESETTNTNANASDHVFDTNTPLVIGAQTSSRAIGRRTQSSGQLQNTGYNAGQDGETTESSLYDDIETDSSYSAND